MEYKVVITSDAEEDLDRMIRYLIIEKQNRQAAENVLNDFVETRKTLAGAAGNLKLCDNPRLRAWIPEDSFPVAPVFHALPA